MKIILIGGILLYIMTISFIVIHQFIVGPMPVEWFIHLVIIICFVAIPIKIYLNAPLLYRKENIDLLNKIGGIMMETEKFYKDIDIDEAASSREQINELKRSTDQLIKKFLTLRIKKGDS
jgi:hypothetical protein